jgi:exopolysaccharide biosynthesis polyprenyl glycosylphosphotransferase
MNPPTTAFAPETADPRETATSGPGVVAAPRRGPAPAWSGPERRSRPRTVPMVASRHPARDHVVRRLLAIADAGAVASGIVLAAALGIAKGGMYGTSLEISLAFVPAMIVVFKAIGLYERDVRQISHNTIDDIPDLIQGLLVGSVILWVTLHALGEDDTFAIPLGGLTLAFPFLLFLRAMARRAGTRWLGPERVLLIGQDPSMSRLVSKLRGPSYVEVVGVVGSCRLAADVPTVGHLAGFDLDRLVAQHAVERVIVGPLPDGTGYGDSSAKLRLEVMRACKRLRVKVAVVPELADAMGTSVVMDDIQGITVLGVQPPVLSRSSQYLKRGIDVIGAAGLCLLLAPVLACAALAVKLTSPGPVFFRQCRVGLYGRRFRIVKFRTMVVGAEDQQQALRALSRDPDWLLLDEDPRITHVGRFLRSTSIDELPQLWNVLRGQMSLVGPRPIIESEDERLEGWRRGRVDLKPGITGLWQILGRTEIPFEEMVKLDYMYVTNWSLWTDIRLILRTMPAVFATRGAN